MRRIKKRYIFIPLLLASVAVLCFVRWHAWFDVPVEPVWEGPTQDYQFPTFEQDNTPQSTDILVLGDIHNSLRTADYDRIASIAPQIDVVAQIGDWMDRGQNYHYQLLLQEWMPSQLMGTPVIACPGNHEYSKGLLKARSEVWDKAFQYPENGPVGVPGASFYIDLPCVRLIAIDTNPLWRVVHFTRTLTWLHRTMDSAGDKFIVVLMHHPVISVAKGRFNAGIYTFFRTVLGQADLVIAGHEHLYMRRLPFVMLNSGGTPKTPREHLHAEALDSIPVFSVISIQKPLVETPAKELLLRTYRVEDGVLIDSAYVSHE